MILTDYLRPEKDVSWDYAAQCGVSRAVIRLPDQGFDVTDAAHWKSLISVYHANGFTPLVLEPLPDWLHTPIKTGSPDRDRCIDQVIRMFPCLRANGIRVLCFNFMAYVGWCRTSDQVVERGGALVTGFRLSDYIPTDDTITEQELWEHYRYFIKAVLPHAEKNGIYLALHPDDPPVARLGNVRRILTSLEQVQRAVHLVSSPNLGVTLCQGCFRAMGEDLEQVIRSFAQEKKIFYVHFRDVAGCPTNFHETFHDNGPTDMAKILKLYHTLGVHVPIRVDHVPKMAGEAVSVAGYGALGRLFAIGYLKGMLEMLESN